MTTRSSCCEFLAVPNKHRALSSKAQLMARLKANQNYGFRSQLHASTGSNQFYTIPALEQSQVDKFSAERCARALILVGSLSFFPVGGTSNVKGQPQVPQNYGTHTFSIIIMKRVAWWIINIGAPAIKPGSAATK